MSCKHSESMYRIKEKRIVIYGQKHMDSFLDDVEFGNAWCAIVRPVGADHRFRRCVLSTASFDARQPDIHGCTFVWYVLTV